MFRLLTRTPSGVFREEKAALVPVERGSGGQSSALSFSFSRRRIPPHDDGCALARECAKTKILRTPSRRAQRALVSRRSRCAQIRAESVAVRSASPRASRGAERRGFSWWRMAAARTRTCAKGKKRGRKSGGRRRKRGPGVSEEEVGTEANPR